ncbi:glycosyltransferase family 4 protein [Bacteroides sp. AN502(2024)]|uniref:glycosyltransferase family 4 protein n=1 Tax=Bacteroides sp. AN502(2024) TaxID=3160599 RepID=UPI003515F6B6
MKAIFPCSYYLPETAASLYITDNIVHACAENGVEVDLYTPTPTRSVPAGSQWEREEHWENGKLRVHRFHLYGEGKNPLLRAMRYFLGEFALLHFCLWKDYDVAFIDSTPPIQGLKMPLIKWFKRKPTVYNAQDIFPDSLVGTGLTRKGSLIWKMGRIVEKITYKYADKIIVISEDFRKNLLAKGVPANKIVVVYNWVDQNVVVDISREKNKLFDSYGLDRSKFYVTYNGNIGLTQNMDMLLSVAGDFQEEYEDISFVLVGNGAYLDEVKRIVAERKLNNVYLLPFQPYSDISHVFSLGDASLVISKPGVGSNSVPSKTWSIMSASRPVLANFDPNELKQIIEEYKCGIFTKAGDKEAFKESILKLYNDRELCKEYGRNGRQFVMDNLTREVGTAKYVEAIKSVIKR